MISVRLDKSLLVAPIPDDLRWEEVGSNKVTIQLPTNGNIIDVLKNNGIVLAQPVSVVINGQAADLGQEIQPNDEVLLLPQIAGGD